MISLCQEKSKADDDPFGDEPDDGQAFHKIHKPRKTWVSALHLQIDDIEWYWIFTPILMIYDHITLNIKLMILNDIDVNVMWMSSRALVGSRSQISHLTRTMDGWIRSGMTCLMRSRLQRPAGSSLSWWNNLKTIVNITIIVMTITMIIYYYLCKSRCGIVAYLDLFLER